MDSKDPVASTQPPSTPAWAVSTQFALPQGDAAAGAGATGSGAGGMAGTATPSGAAGGATGAFFLKKLNIRSVGDGGRRTSPAETL